MAAQLILSFFALTAGVSIGAWIMLFFQSSRIAVSAAITICIIAALGTAAIEKMFGSDKQAIVFADHGAIWVVAFAVSSGVFYYLRPNFF